ncbi:1-aminocyclopropane-1-carboxylate deaminase [Leptospira stimsonii]|uniref:1-aminocyclopropane-1-carboxylate deaminase n=2 Tax=Leptospira stimsonii TaxID=2202203 RepID=A0A396Z7J9_9LEPT|nr:1-aminocyclopropane-1-carboxylate deaminase [Leptospira stimsonii]RHX89684.1 1-aminocyclopropane-1-carboxylate deaminase [Leptospira stimsonii]
MSLFQNPLRFQLSSPEIHRVWRMRNAELFVARDDTLAMGMGTKLRKFFGIHSTLEKSKTKNVILQGELHSNALSAFSFFFRNFGYQIETIAYVRNRERTTANSIFVKRNSHSLEVFHSRKEWKERMDRIPVKKEGKFLLPEYGFLSEASNSLDTLWEGISFSQFDFLVLDIGSGLTWLSANRYFQNSIPILGISVGLPKGKMISWLEEKKEFLGHTEYEIAEERILEFRSSQGFGFKDIRILEYCKEFYAEYDIPIEPLYSGKSLFEIQRRCESGELKGKVLYLHQGGLWNFLDLFLPSQKNL